MLGLQLTHQSRPIAAAIVFVATVAMALLAVLAMQTPRDRRDLLRWLRQAPVRLSQAGAGALWPVNWWRAARRRPRLWGVVTAVVAFLIIAPLVLYRVSPRVRLGVAFVRVSERAEGSTLWAPVIQEGRAAVPFLISQFTAGETREQHSLNRRLDAVLRLTLEWLHWRQPFTTDPSPPQPASRQSWQLWWEVNASRVPELGRDDDAYQRWRRERTTP